jgi:hypothetical protein
MFIKTELNIGSERYFPDGPFRRAEARRSIKMFYVPKGAHDFVVDSEVPFLLVTEPMVDRYLELRPPQFRLTTTFDLIIAEIERAFVFGQFFAAVAASVVSIERMLNEARIRLHEHASPKLGELWGKGPLNEWSGNVDALVKWGYLQADLADELKSVFEIRCQYLHSAPITSPEEDARRCVHAAFSVLTEFIGFPERLFKIGSSIEYLDPSNPLFEVFYKPALTETIDPTSTG